ncbi:MAG: hypothetical protein JNK25_12325 [Phycisphaerae bacterium]|nr:hypothetical protein [Phycisphaerae bacterium]
MRFPIVSLLIPCLVLLGCGGVFRGGGGDARMVSVASGDVVSMRPTTVVYAKGFDASSADFYISDLPPEVWRNGGDVSDYSGSILHMHVFISPKAGRTPISNQASSSTARWLILSSGRVGVYGGGGFALKSGDVGDTSLGGRITEASMRLLRASEGFEDRLGASRLNASFTARHDPEESALIARTLAALTAHSGEVK